MVPLRALPATLRVMEMVGESPAKNELVRRFHGISPLSLLLPRLSVRTTGVEVFQVKQEMREGGMVPSNSFPVMSRLTSVRWMTCAGSISDEGRKPVNVLSATSNENRFALESMEVVGKRGLRSVPFNAFSDMSISTEA